jgi:cation diffusion facilitator family transporter
MHDNSLKDWTHNHDFALDNEFGERRTQYVLWLTAITMIVEIIAGTVYGSMALLADGWHMATHVAAFLIAIYAYRYARRHADNPAYAFGTGKVNVLGGFASAVSLAVVSLMMVIESLQRFFTPNEIHFNEAIFVACLGLIINIVSALLLKDEHHHHHDPEHAHDDQGHHHDHNLHAAYMHVIADVMTSILAIGALLSGKFFGWHWLDPMMGIVGGLIIARWSLGLVRQTGPVLLDESIEADYLRGIREVIESDSDNRITDMHVWKISPHHHAAIISIVTSNPRPTEYYKNLLADFSRLSHLTIEINLCKE